MEEKVVGTHSQHWPEQEAEPQVLLQRMTERVGQSTLTALQKLVGASKRMEQMVFGLQAWTDVEEP